jgi:uncharacterized zinc-type alcohol dehydrogenase-like protein
MIDNEWGMSSYPLVAGHEVIGRVAALGSAAQDKGLKVGQKVGIGWTARSCGHCDAASAQSRSTAARLGADHHQSHRLCRAARDCQWVIPLPESIDVESAGPMLAAGSPSLPLLMHHVTATAVDLLLAGADHIRHRSAHERVMFLFMSQKQKCWHLCVVTFM